MKLDINSIEIFAIMKNITHEIRCLLHIIDEHEDVDNEEEIQEIEVLIKRYRELKKASDGVE